MVCRKKVNCLQMKKRCCYYCYYCCCCCCFFLCSFFFSFSSCFSRRSRLASVFSMRFAILFNFKPYFEPRYFSHWSFTLRYKSIVNRASSTCAEQREFEQRHSLHPDTSNGFLPMSACPLEFQFPADRSPAVSSQVSFLSQDRGTACILMYLWS